jgi:hypothetical protein
MSESARNEARYLSVGEREVVDHTHQPALKALSDEDFAQTRKLVRELRDRARDISHRQRRQIRGKADASGARPATDDTGSRRKLSILAAAMKRLSAEDRRRRARVAKEELVALSRGTLSRRRANARGDQPLPGQTATGAPRVESASPPAQAANPS